MTEPRSVDWQWLSCSSQFLSEPPFPSLYLRINITPRPYSISSVIFSVFRFKVFSYGPSGNPKWSVWWWSLLRLLCWFPVIKKITYHGAYKLPQMWLCPTQVSSYPFSPVFTLAFLPMSASCSHPGALSLLFLSWHLTSGDSLLSSKVTSSRRPTLDPKEPFNHWLSHHSALFIRNL